MFDFKKNEILKIDRIIHAAFSNKNLEKYRNKFKKAHMDLRSRNSKPLIDKVNLLMPEVVDKFDDAKIRLYDLASINLPDFMPEAKYIEQLKGSSWHGPYIWNDYPDWLEFYTVTSEGKFNGIRLVLRLDEPDIRLHYVMDSITVNREEYKPDDLSQPKIFKL